jgi:hypothetical protein
VYPEKGAGCGIFRMGAVIGNGDGRPGRLHQAVIAQVGFRTSHDMGFKSQLLNGLLIFATGFQCHAMTFH